jgi:hypothetical protein
MPEPVNRDWIEAELRSLREYANEEQKRVNERFLQVNELRQQVLEERGVFVRHEALASVSDRLARLEQTYIARTEYEALGSRVFLIEKQGITRTEYDQHGGRIGKLEALGPIIVLVAGVIGAVIGGLVIKYFSGGA